MVRDTACRSVLLAVSILLMWAALSSAQSGKRRPQEPRGVTAVSSSPTAYPSERRVALVNGTL
jgi:hypothetical protein